MQMPNTTAEQQARDILERIGVPNAQSYAASDLVELANLISERSRAALAAEPQGTATPVEGMPKELGEVTKTSRGFEVVEFLDCYENPCELQQSSLAVYATPGTSAVWLGLADQRMHLDVDQVEALISTLQRWVDSGSFKVQSDALPAPEVQP